MKINKQLFEDVLAGKLKGTFVLRNGFKCNSDELSRCKSDGCNNTYLYCLINEYSYTQFGYYFDSDRRKSNVDIIDFIPDTDMKENELTIEIPDGKTVDWEESKKQNKIVLKDKRRLTYEEICDKLDGMIDIPLFDTPSEDGNALVANEHYLECLLAKNRLANVAKYLNDEWKPIYATSVWIIVWDCYLGYHATSIQAGSTAFKCYGLVIFKSKELAQQAIEILGEETIKLALEHLGV